MITPAVEKLIDLALAEDLGTGDVTSQAIIGEKTNARARLVAKQPVVVSGLDVFARVFHRLDPTIVISYRAREGQLMKKGALLAELRGNARALLAGERTALNFIRHLCGVATSTAILVEELAGTGCRLLDTRKTTPGMRQLEKAAVRAGGGNNHRFGLFDGVLIKDNHIVAAGSIEKAVRKARRYAPPTLRVEVECASLRQVKEALSAGADIIMLDNMSLEQMRRAVKLIGGRALCEASGNITAQNARRVATCGVDFISCGSITHSAAAADLSLEFVRS